MPPATEVESARVTRTWTYAGRRIATSGRLVNLWVDEDGDERLFLKLPATAIGSSYTVDTSPDAKSVYPASLKWVQGAPVNPRAAGWELADRAAYTQHMALKAEKRAATADRLGTLTLAEARVQMADAVGANRIAMLAQILRYLGA